MGKKNFWLNQVFHTPIWVHSFFFLLWDLKHRVKILDLGVLWELWVHHFQLLLLGHNHGLYTFHSLRFFFYWLIMTRKIIGWILEWWLTIWLGGVVSPLTIWRVVMIIPVLFIVLRMGYVLIRIRPIRLTRLVKVMICRVCNIRVKRGWSVIWITIKIWKIIVISHITQEMSKTNKEK